MFCGPETVGPETVGPGCWTRGEAERNIDSRGSTKHTAFPRSQSISILLNTQSQRNEKIKRTSYENT